MMCLYHGSTCTYISVPVQVAVPVLVAVPVRVAVPVQVAEPVDVPVPEPIPVCKQLIKHTTRTQIPDLCDYSTRIKLSLLQQGPDSLSRNVSA